MNMKSTTLIASIIAAGLVAAGPARSTDTASLPAAHEQGRISYITGGIGEDEAAALKQAAATYPLEMLFVQKGQPKDEFLADIRVSIRNRSGASMLETTADGPFLLARLPDGKYNIEAEYRGELKHQTVDIRSGRHQRAVFVWAPREDSENPVVGSAY
jgi:hypothetical protein